MYKGKELKQDELIAWLRLARSTTASEFFDYLKLDITIESILKNSIDKIYSVDEAEQELKKANEIGAKIIAAYEPEFPDSLRNVVPIITVLGDISLLNYEVIAIVGDRSVSEQSKKFSKELATSLMKANFVIAYDLDMVITKPAIAVTANSIDIESKEINEIVNNCGLIVTSSPFTTKLKSEYLFQKSKIIAGLSLGVIVTEAAKNSNSLITIVCALDQKKEVFAIPGSPSDSRYDENNSLIKHDARLIESAADVINALKTINPVKYSVS